MHKNTKLTPTLRREVYQSWSSGRASLRQLGFQYHVDKNIIQTVIVRGKLGDFSVHDSTNHRYRCLEYGLKRLARTETAMSVVLAKRQHRANRYERLAPGELVHGDTKRLSQILRSGKYRQVLAPSEVLYIWITRKQ